MEYIDPFPVTCEHCGFSDEYPLDELKKYQANCKSCSELLKECPDTMRKNAREHYIEMWPAHFIFDAFESWGVDLDEVTDTEFDAIETVSDLVCLVETKLNIKISHQINKLPMLTECRVNLELDSLLKMKLAELAATARSD